MYFSSQSEQRKLEMDRVYQESVDIQKKLDRIRAFVIDKRQTVLQEELPLRVIFNQVFDTSIYFEPDE